jgi:chromosome segregation ATPase
VDHEEVDGIKVPKFKSDKDFRGWGLGGYKKAKQLETDLTALQTRFADLEKEVPTTKAERQQLATKLADMEKRMAEKESEIQFMNYERSGEYKEKYEKPYQDAINSAYEDISQLTITEDDRTQPADDEGKYPTKDRPAKSSDFDQIYQLPLGAAAKLAAKKFGPESAAIVMDHWREVRNLAKSAVGALNSWKETSTKREEEQKTQSIQTRERVAGLWTQVNADIKEKNKDLFNERPDDNEWNEELGKGTKMADAYFSDRSQQPVEQRVIFDAHVRNRIAAFPAQVSENRRIKAQLEQANKDLAALRGSAPGAPDSQNPNPPAEESTGALDAFDKVL